MPKTVYLRRQLVGLLENFPGSLADTIFFNGYNTGLTRYYEVDGNSSFNDDDYLEFTVAEMTFTPQNLSLTGTAATEVTTYPYPIWEARLVPDTFVIPAPPRPDLAVKVKSITPATVADNGTLTFNLDIKNIGNADSGDPKLALYLSTDSTITTSDTLLLDFDITGPSAGETYGMSFSFPLSGTY